MNIMLRFLMIIFLLSSFTGASIAKETTGNPIPKKAKLTGLVKSLTDKEINIMEYGLPFNFEADNKIKIDEKGNFSTELELKEGQYFYIIYKRQAQLIYLNPGDELDVTFDGRKINSTIEYKGTGVEVNEFLKNRTEMDKVSQQLANHGGQKYGLYMLEWDEYTKMIDENRAVMQTALNQFKKDKKVKGNLERFAALEQATIDGTWGMYYMQFPGHHAHFAKKDPRELWHHLEIDKIKKELISDDERLLMSRAYRDFMNQYTLTVTEKTLMQSNVKLKSKSEFINRTFQNVDNVLPERWQREYMKSRLLYEQIDKHGINNMKEMVDAFKALDISNPSYDIAVQKAWDKWALTLPGAQAPEIVGTDINGKEVKLSDFRGKIVYIDVWATWCGPCRKEIPHLQKTEAAFHGKDVVFLSVSIDKNKKKWENMVKEQELGGVQILAPGGWGADICKKYNITGIPRFMLIDKEGKIINTKTLRPSQGVGNLLDEHLQEG